MARPRLHKLAIVTTVVICLLIFSIFFYSSPPDWRFRDSFSSEERRVETYNFEETVDEAKCFNQDMKSSPIPNVVHFRWGFHSPKINFMNYLAIRSALVSLKPDILKLHYEELNMDNVWFKKLQDSITLVHHDIALEYPRQTQEKWQASHLADVLRLDILQKEGGIYMDTDVIALRPFDALRHSKMDVVLGHEGGDRHCLCNAIILARKDTPFISQWIKRYSDFSAKEWNYHSVILPKQMALDHPDQVCTLAPSVLFWPTWTSRHIR